MNGKDKILKRMTEEEIEQGLEEESGKVQVRMHMHRADRKHRLMQVGLLKKGRRRAVTFKED